MRHIESIWISLRQSVCRMRCAMSPFRRFVRHSIATEMETVCNYFVTVAQIAIKRSNQLHEIHFRFSFVSFYIGFAKRSHRWNWVRCSLYRPHQLVANIVWNRLAAEHHHCCHHLPRLGRPFRAEWMPIGMWSFALLVVAYKPANELNPNSMRRSYDFHSLEYAIDLVKDTRRHQISKCCAKLFIQCLILRRKLIEFRLQII